MTHDDDILMAYVDGELDEARRREIESALARDPALARRIEEHRALRARLNEAFAPVLRQPVPAQLEEIARSASRDATRGNIVPFPARATRPATTPWRAREWTAIAASLVLGVFLSWRFLAPQSGSFASADGALVAAGDLATALDTKLASESAGGTVQIGLSFKAEDGAYCRSFLLRKSATAGFACRDEGQWNISMIQSVHTAPGGDLRPAGAEMPPAILAAIESRLSGEALDADAERAARDARWATR